MKMRCAVFLLVAGSAAAAQAQLLIFDGGIPGTTGASNRAAGSSPITFISAVTANTDIVRIDVLNQLNADGNLKFLIFEVGNNSPLYVSAPKPFTASSTPTWKDSDPLSFQLIAGRQYFIGAIADVSGLWPFRTVPASYTQGALTSTNRNGNVSNFGSPTAVGPGSADIPVRLYVVPAPGALALLGLGGLAAARRRR
jgi:hypothetical protein